MVVTKPHPSGMPVGMVPSDAECVRLQDRDLVDERHRPYTIRWLQRFLAGPGGDQRLAPEDAQWACVELLERESVPERQVVQAARAVELHHKHYLRFRLGQL